MRANDLRSFEVLRHGAYVCLRVSEPDRRKLAAAPVGSIAGELGFTNEFEAPNGHPERAVAYLHRVTATRGAREDAALIGAGAVIHVAAPSEAPVAEFCGRLIEMFGAAIVTRVYRGVVRPPSFTGNAMHNFAYAHQVVQQPASLMPNVFLMPLSKNAAWWSKDWMERHTYFLPRYDGDGKMLAEGHALSASAGVAGLLRRTYKWPVEPAPEHEYDFVTYFECSDENIPLFQEVCTKLRDTARNPEWRFVREGPTWQGRRMPAWEALF